MDFSFSEQQEMLRKIARDFLSTECPRESVRELLKDVTGYPPELWTKMAELGWTGLIIPEQYGGIEGDFCQPTQEECYHQNAVDGKEPCQQHAQSQEAQSCKHQCAIAPPISQRAEYGCSQARSLIDSYQRRD